MTALGYPRVHYDQIGSTSDRAKELAAAGATHGTLVTAAEQSAGHGRSGRSWFSPRGEALSLSLVLRDAPELLTIAAGVAVAEAIGPEAQVKWPNDVLVDGRKVAGLLAERRTGEDWTVLGIGVNVAVREFPEELRETAGSLGRTTEDVAPLLESLLDGLGRWLAAPAAEVLAAWQARDALAGQAVTWSDGSGVARGVDDAGRLLVELAGGATIALDAGEVRRLTS